MKIRISKRLYFYPNKNGVYLIAAFLIAAIWTPIWFFVKHFMPTPFTTDVTLYLCIPFGVIASMIAFHQEVGYNIKD